MPGSAVAPTIALRIDDQGQVVAGVYDGTNPDAPDEERMNNDLRWRFSVEYEVPDASEFERPEGPIYTYPPSQYPPSEAP